jgi:hypothetical protein
LNPDFPATIENAVNESLTWFERNLNGKIPTEFRDINNFKSIIEFQSKIKELMTPSRSEIKDSVRVVLDNERFKIVVPLTFEASKLYGTGTKWCTTNKTHYDNYMGRGILYYIIDKTLNRKFGHHVPENVNIRTGYNSVAFFNNEDASLNLNTIRLIYGDSFNVVTDAVKEDFSKMILVKQKAKALKLLEDSVNSVKRSLKHSGVNDTEIESLVNTFLDSMRGEKKTVESYPF